MRHRIVLGTGGTFVARRILAVATAAGTSAASRINALSATADTGAALAAPWGATGT